MAPGGYEIATLAAGGSIAMVDAVLDGCITNGYALTRYVLTQMPPAAADCGLWLCGVDLC
jgi:hypothetical protein